MRQAQTFGANGSKRQEGTSSRAPIGQAIETTCAYALCAYAVRMNRVCHSSYRGLHASLRRAEVLLFGDVSHANNVRQRDTWAEGGFEALFQSLIQGQSRIGWEGGIAAAVVVYRRSTPPARLG